MAEKIINAADNPAMANDLINQALASDTQTQEPTILNPSSDTLVDLPGGYIKANGEVIKTAEVRELNGRDEEAIAKAGTLGKAFNLILSRAVVKIGEMTATEEMLDELLAGDRDALMLGIYRATFGPVTELVGYSESSSELKTIEVNIDEDIKVKVMADPLNDRAFKVLGRNHTYLVTLPTGKTQKELAQFADKTGPELTTILLENTVLEIDDKPVISKIQVQSIGMGDRRKISEEMAKRAPGPQFDDIRINDPEGDGEVVVPLNLGTLFRF